MTQNQERTYSPIADVVLAIGDDQHEAPLSWVTLRNTLTVQHMEHLLTLRQLQQSDFEVERELYYNEIKKRFGLSISNIDDAEIFMEHAANVGATGHILPQVAPAAVQQVKQIIAGVNVQHLLADAGIPVGAATQSMRKQLSVTHAYAEAMGGRKGIDAFKSLLRSHKDSLIKGLGDQRVGLAISGALLGLSVAVTTNPIGITLGAIKLTEKLLKTETGQEFTKGFYANCNKFFLKIGVKPEIISELSDALQAGKEQMANSRWRRVATIAFTGALAIAAGSVAVDHFDLSISALPTEVEHLNSATPHSISVQLPATMAVKVEQGDTLWTLCKEHLATRQGLPPSPREVGLMVERVADFNNLQSPDHIAAGSEIRFPTEQVVTGTNSPGAYDVPQSKPTETTEAIRSTPRPSLNLG